MEPRSRGELDELKNSLWFLVYRLWLLRAL
jgi:hypothetical protein